MFSRLVYIYFRVFYVDNVSHDFFSHISKICKSAAEIESEISRGINYRG